MSQANELGLILFVIVCRVNWSIRGHSSIIQGEIITKFKRLIYWQQYSDLMHYLMFCGRRTLWITFLNGTWAYSYTK